MLNITLFSQIVGFAIGAGAVIIALAFAYSQIKLGDGNAKKELIQTLQETVTAKEETISRLEKEKTNLVLSHQVQLTQLTKDLSELRGRFDELTKQNTEYKAILQGRDPDTLNTLKMLTEIKDGIVTLNQHHELSEKVLLERSTKTATSLLEAADKVRNEKSK